MAAGTVSTPITAKTASSLALREQRFRSARPLKASGIFRFEVDLAVTAITNEDTFTVFTFPEDLGEIYLRNLWVFDDTDATAIWKAVYFDAGAEIPLSFGTNDPNAGKYLTIAEAVPADDGVNANSVGATLVTLKDEDRAGQTVTLVALDADPAAATDGGKLVIEAEVVRKIECGTVTAVGNG